jgi:amino acid permease
MEQTKEFKRRSNEKVDVFSSTTDSEANNEVYESNKGAATLHRTMKNRHIAMIRYVHCRPQHHEQPR